MATNKPTITTINDTFTEFKQNLNRVSLDLGATGRLTTAIDSDTISAINELDSDLHGSGGGQFRSEFNFKSFKDSAGSGSVLGALNQIDHYIGDSAGTLEVNATNIVGAINEIEGVFDASEFEISAGSNQFDVTSGAFNVDASGDISLDADGGDVFFKDDGTTYGSVTNGSGNIIIKSGTSTMLTGSGTDATFNNDLTVENDLTVDGATSLNGNVDLGDANTDTISFTGRVDTNIVPSTDNTRDLGTSALQFRDLYIDGTAYIDNLDADSAEIGDINITGSTIDVNGDLTLKSTTGDIVLDANGADIVLEDNGTDFAKFTNSSGSLHIVAQGQDNDIKLIGDDGGSAVTALHLDMSDNGKLITSGNIGMGGDTITRTGSLKIDASANITLDADGGNIYLNDGTSNFTSFAHLGSNNLRFSVNGTVFDVVGEKVNFAKPIMFDSAMNTDASTVVGAINEMHDSIGSGGLNTTAQTLVGAVNEHETNLGTMSLNTSASNVTAAINELHTTIGTDIDSDGRNGNLANNNIGLGLYRLDSAIGNLDSLDATDVSDHQNLVSAINAVAADVAQLDSDNSAVDTRIGSLGNLVAEFTGSDRNSIVNALNALQNALPDIYDDTGTLLN